MVNANQINIRCEKELKRYLEDLDIDYSKYIRDLIYNDRVSKSDPDIIKNLINQKKIEIKQLEEKLNSPHPMMEEINKFFKQQAPSYKENAPHRTTEQKHRFIKQVILPKLKKYGYKATVEEIDQILINFPEDNGGH